MKTKTHIPLFSKKNITVLVIFAFAALVLASCDVGAAIDTDPGPKVTVYVVGLDNSKPCYWVNGEKVEIPVNDLGENPNASNITVSNGSVYVAGGYFSGSANHYYYKKGSSQPETLVFPESSNNNITGIAGYGGSAYVTGYYQTFIDGQYYSRACYWKDGSCTQLSNPEPKKESMAHAITISNGSVYVAGTYDGKACYWKDGEVPVTLGELQLGNYLSDASLEIAVSNTGLVCVAASNRSEAWYWKDNVRTELVFPYGATKKIITGIDVSGETVYVAGRFGEKSYEKACYWVNGNKTDLFNSKIVSCIPGNIVFFDNSVFVGCSYLCEIGAKTRGFGYWKDGTLHLKGNIPILADRYDSAIEVE